VTTHAATASTATRKLDPPFRADHVGSLLRAPALLERRERFDGPEFDPIRAKAKPADLVEMEDRLVLEAIALQERVGLQSITDGDFRRRSWFADFMVELQGISIGWGTDSIVFRSAEGTTRPTPRVNVEGKVRWPQGGITVAAYKYLAAHARGKPKITIPTPLQAHAYGGTFNKAAYADEAAYWDDMIAAYHAELAALRAAGCDYVQVDECTLIKLCDPKFLDLYRSRGEDPAKVKAFYVDILRRLTDGKPAGMTLAMHICRGNSRGHWAMEGEYEPIADVIFTELGFDAYFLEYDSPRAGDFRPLRHAPKDKTVVLGLVTTKSPQLEGKDELKRRIEEAARYVSLDQLCLSPQCGFASSKYGNPVAAADQERKLRLVVETAHEVWG
jgi:5-methyltetrahydropteroyltriglutamate--homocysteine methyltransferase